MHLWCFKKAVSPVLNIEFYGQWFQIEVWLLVYESKDFTSSLTPSWARDKLIVSFRTCFGLYRQVLVDLQCLSNNVSAIVFLYVVFGADSHKC